MHERWSRYWEKVGMLKVSKSKLEQCLEKLNSDLIVADTWRDQR